MKALILVALLAAAALAGCAGNQTTVSSSSSQAPPPPLPFARTITTVAAQGTGEPSLGVTPDGTLFTDVGSHVYTSSGNGTNWTDLGDINAPITNFDPDLAVDSDGVVWESRLNAAACTAVSISKDKGKTWTHSQAVCDAPVNDRQYVIPTHGGTAYLYSHQLPSFQQLAMKTTDYGLTWVPTTPPEGVMPHFLLANGGSGWGGGGFYNAKTGSVWFTFNYDEGKPTVLTASTSHAGYAMTPDGGLTWKLGFAGDLTGQALGLGLVTGAADDNGTVYITWGETAGDGVAIYVASSHDDGATWSPKVRVDHNEHSKAYPIMAAGLAGHVAVAYYESAESGVPDNSKGPWNVTLASTDDFAALQASNGTFQFGALSVLPVKKTPICTGGSGCGGDREFDDYFDLVRMPDGRVGAIYNVLDGKGLHNAFAMTEAPLLGALPAPAKAA